MTRRNGLQKSVAFVVFILLGFLKMTGVHGKSKRVYPVNASHPFDKQTYSCYHSGDYKSFRPKKGDCYYLYGKLIMDNQDNPDLYDLRSITGCVVFAKLPALKKLNYVISFRRNTRFCEYKYALLVYGNPNLEWISLKVRPGSAFIKANRQLQRKNAVNGALDVGTDQDCTVEIALVDKKCKALVGDVEYHIRDKENQEMWSRINKVYGTITVNQAESDLRLLKNITVEAWSVRAVRIVNNQKLKYIDALLDMKLEGPKPLIYFRNNSRFCHTIDIRKKIETKANRGILWEDCCLRECKGGTVSTEYLEGFDKFCNEIDGDLVIEGQKGIPVGIEKLAQIERINGRLVVKHNTAIKDLSFLGYLNSINNDDTNKPSVYVNNNSQFNMTGLKSIGQIHGNVVVVTEKLEDVPQDMKKKITEVTDGKATFLTFAQYESLPLTTTAITNSRKKTTHTTARSTNKGTISSDRVSTTEEVSETTDESGETTGSTMSTGRKHKLENNWPSSGQVMEPEEPGHKTVSILFMTLFVLMLFVIPTIIIVVVVFGKLVSRREKKKRRKSKSFSSENDTKSPAVTPVKKLKSKKKKKRKKKKKKEKESSSKMSRTPVKSSGKSDRPL